MWLNGIGIRVTDMERSLKFYRDVIGLREVARGGARKKGNLYVLIRDPRSGQKLELNWYSPDPNKSLFGTPYVLGEALDHMEVRVESVPETLKCLEALGIKALDMQPYFDPDEYPSAQRRRRRHHVAYIANPDGIQLCLYDHPEEPRTLRLAKRTDERTKSPKLLIRDVLHDVGNADHQRSDLRK